MKTFKSFLLALVLAVSIPILAWGDFPTSLTNAVDGETEIFASHLNNLEGKVGVDNSAVTSSLDYMLRHSGSIDPGHKHTPPYGGTGIYIYVIGDLLYASSSSALSRLAGVATGNALISGGINTAPAWGKVALTTHISGTLPVANGGTNIASYAVGDIPYASGATTLSKLAGVAIGQVLVSGGVTTAPEWSNTPILYNAAGSNKYLFLTLDNANTGYASRLLFREAADRASVSWYSSAWGATKQNRLVLETFGAYPISFWTNNVEEMIIASGGIVTMAHYGVGAATFDASGNISSASDERLKIIQGKYTAGLKELMGIQPINYKWNKKSGMEMKHTYAGFSAQNIQKVLPEAVYENKEGTLSFNDRAILAAAVNAIKELDSKVVTLEAKVKRLEAKSQ